MKNCIHPQTRPTRAEKSNGVTCVYLQCESCGEKTKEDKKANYFIEGLPWFDTEFRDRQRELQRTQRAIEQQKRVNSLELHRRQQQLEWFAEYAKYLNTPHWQATRRNVLYRDRFECQNCFRRVTDSNAHAHHISYDGYKRLGKSFAFECVTLCRDCHRAFHEEADNDW